MRRILSISITALMLFGISAAAAAPVNASPLGPYSYNGQGRCSNSVFAINRCR